MIINKSRISVISLLPIFFSLIMGAVAVARYYKPESKPSSEKVVAMTGTEMVKNIDAMNKKNIVFDMTGVLFNPSKRYLLTEIGFLNLAWYSVRHLANPFNIIERLTEFLMRLRPQTTDRYKYKGTVAPEICIDWQVGKISGKEVIAIIDKAAEEEGIFVSEVEKTIVTRAAKAIFNPESLVDKSLKPIETGIDLLKAFAHKKDSSGNKVHRVYLLSNFDKDTVPLLMDRYPDLFALFDGIVFSGQAGMLKPDKEMYQHFFAKYHLDPTECFFIDDQEENIVAGNQLGMDGVQFLG